METRDVLAHVPGAPPPATEAPAAPAPDTHAAAKAAFQSLLKDQKAGEAPNTKAAKAASQAKAAPEKAKPAVKAEPEAEAPAAADPEAEKLRRKMRLAGTPEKALKSLSDSEVREWWSLEEERESVRAEALQRAAAAEKKLSAVSKATAEEEPKHGVPTSNADLEDIAEELAAQFGEDESGTILKALERLTAPMTTRLQQLEYVIRTAQEKGREDIASKNRTRLAEKLTLSDKAWESLKSEVLQAFQNDPKAYPTPEAAFDDVFEARYGEILAEREKSKDSEVDPQKDLKAKIKDASPSSPASQKSAKKVEPKDQAFAAWRHLLKNGAEDADGATRAFSRAGLPQ